MRRNEVGEFVRIPTARDNAVEIVELRSRQPLRCARSSRNSRELLATVISVMLVDELSPTGFWYPTAIHEIRPGVQALIEHWPSPAVIVEISYAVLVAKYAARMYGVKCGPSHLCFAGPRH